MSQDLKLKRSTEQIESLFHVLDARRRRMGISYATLATRSGVSMATVVRILSGRYQKAGIDNVLAIANSLGMQLQFCEQTSIADLEKQQAEQKAKRLIGALQGTSALESQALEQPELEEMTRQTVHELLAGSRRRLWDD